MFLFPLDSGHIPTRRLSAVVWARCRMNHWRVRLAGEPFDLQELARWFPSGDVYVTQIEDVYYIAGERFDSYRQTAD
jgi:hypothetical protein